MFYVQVKRENVTTENAAVLHLYINRITIIEYRTIV